MSTLPISSSFSSSSMLSTVKTPPTTSFDELSPSTKELLQQAKGAYQFFDFCYKSIGKNYSLYFGQMNRQIEQIRDLQLNKQNLPESTFTQEFSPSIKSAEDLIAELTKKVEEVAKGSFDSWGGSFPPPPSSYVLETPVEFLEGCVGFKRKGNNCWVAGFLQSCLIADYLKVGVIEVGEFYKKGNLLDFAHVESIKKYFSPSFSTDEDSIKEIVVVYNKIREPIIKLDLLYYLITNGIPEHITSRFVCPKQYKQAIAENTAHLGSSLEDPIPIEKVKELLPRAIKTILIDPSIGYLATLKERREDGSALLAAFDAHDTCVVTKNGVPEEVGQSVRVGLSHIIKSKDALSDSPYTTEDTLEALSSLLAERDFIRAAQGRGLPKDYFPIETRRFYKEKGAPQGDKIAQLDAVPLQRDGSGRLFSSTVNYGYQIMLTLPPQAGLTLEDLLERNCHWDDTGEGEYPVSETDRRLQEYSCYQVQTFIQTVPHNLMIELNRFQAGGLHKNSTPVIANEVITIPPEMTSAGKHMAYKLKGFIVHRSNHYITYKLSNENRWIESDDHRQRYVYKEELLQLLHGEKPLATPYFFFYTIVPQSEQEQMLQLSADLREENLNENDRALQIYQKTKVSLALLTDLQEALKKEEIDKHKLVEILKKMTHQCPQLFYNLHQIINIEDGAMEETMPLARAKLFENPGILKTITRKWLWECEGNIVEQLLEGNKTAMRLSEIPLFQLQLRQFNSLLYSKFTNPQTFLELCDGLHEPVRNRLMELLIKEKDRIAFQSATENGTLQGFILKIIVEHPERNPKLLDEEWEKSESEGENRFASSTLNCYRELFKNTKFTHRQLIKAFDFLIPPPFQGPIFLAICRMKGIEPATSAQGKAFFEENPHILDTDILKLYQSQLESS